MKHTNRLLCILLLLCLLAGCAGVPAPGTASGGDSTAEPSAAPALPTVQPAPETEPTHAPEREDPAQTAEGQSGTFTALFPVCDETVIGLIYNEPFTAGSVEPTEIWNEGAYDRLLLIPRFAGTTVRAYACRYDDEGWLNMDEAPTYETVAGDDCVIAAALDRPEGGTAWYVEMELPDGGHAGMELQYNGRYGTPVFEFLQDPYRSTLIEVPTAMEDWNGQMEMIGYLPFWGFWRATQRAGLDAWDAAERFFTPLTEVGDGAAYTAVECDDVYRGVLYLSAARLHTAYLAEGSYALEDLVAIQSINYAQYGNSMGILGPDKGETGEPLVFRLTGLTVYNPSLAAAKVQVTVNGVDCGEFDLTQGDFFTLLPIELPDQPADRPVRIRVEITQTNYGTPADAIIEVWPGLGGNISGAL